MAAAKTLVRLGVDQSQPIDIFKIIREEGIWLLFEPLKNLFGAYVPETGTAGIILHSKHPLSLQRFTAAHEFGHHVLKHSLSLDDEGFIERAQNSSDPREIAADTFAAYFLMPLQLVNTMLRRMGLPREPGELTDVQVYQLALDMGVSYRAAVNHLVTLKKIRPEVGEELRKQSPKTIKAKLGFGELPENPWADVWVLDQTNSGKRLNLRIHDELRISLPETPSSGYIWTLEGAGIVDRIDENRQGELPGFTAPRRRLISEQTEETVKLSEAEPYLALVSDAFEACVSSQTQFGKGGTRYLAFRALRSGQFTLRLLKHRPWQKATEALETFVLELNILPRPTGESEQGLIAQQQQLVAIS